MSLREAAASASSSSGSSRTLAQNVDIAELQKFQQNKDSLQNWRLVAPPTPPDIAASEQEIDFLQFAENSFK